MPVLGENEYSDIPLEVDPQVSFIVACQFECWNELHNLDVNSGTGPDLLPARILKYCAEALAFRGAA